MTPNKVSKGIRSTFAKIAEGGSKAFEKTSQLLEKHQIIAGVIKGAIIAGAAVYIGYNIKHNPEAAKDVLEFRKALIWGDATMGISAPLGLAAGFIGAFVTHSMSERMHNTAEKLHAFAVKNSRE